ncbi:asparagine synthase B [[Clostridium] spiroforme]|nr:asparagine synthase B [Thomasclavelia spiroformis]MBM6879103.1 asparagine synthase B [Thomasclavelia spiroformis]
MCGFLVVGSEEFDLQVFNDALDKAAYRGPDYQHISIDHGITWGFNRLSIMDLSTNGNQPFVYKDCVLVCNGEIYNYPDLKKKLSTEYNFKSGSDCEVLIPLYDKYGIEITCKFLDAEFALVLYDTKTKKLMAARDPMGIRPMFYGYSKHEHQICFASEAKSLSALCDDIMPFPPGHYYLDGQFICYQDLSNPQTIHDDDLETIARQLKDKLEAAVEKRFMSDVPIGYLLSGGLDSSLVCAIGQKLSDKPIRTFAIGMESDPIDLKYAKQVADYLGTEHTEVIMTKEDLYDHLKEVIYHLETFDITTIRASMAMYILCQYIHENTDIKVIMTGEVSDELFGYKYTDFAPDAKSFQEEASKRIKELYMYDVLRADRCISAHALEGRVPFADKSFVEYAMSIDPAKKMNIYNKGKYLLRHAFEDLGYLPDAILFREKAAFSDAVGHSMVDYLKALAEEKYSDEDVLKAKDKYSYCPPFTKESLMYRDIFESFFPGNAQWIKDFWMPNKNWENCDVNDPSARVLKNYGDSGK